MNSILRFLNRPRFLRIPHVRLVQKLYPQTLRAAVTTILQRANRRVIQLKYAVIFGLVGISSWLSISYWLRKPAAPPTLPRASPVRYHNSQPDGSRSVDVRVVRIVNVAVGMRLLDLWGLSRRPNQVVEGICVVCFDGTADTVLLPCRHLVLCEACYGQLCERAASTGVQCPVCRVVVVDQMIVFR